MAGTPRKSSVSKEPHKGDDSTKVHPWRFCPAGQHAVRTHPLHIPPSESVPGGKITTRHFHCARNPSGRDRLDPFEIDGIAKKHFPKLKGGPCPLSLDFDGGDNYDDLIRGWVQYWNDVLKPDQPLDPNLVKALIATESGFKSNSGSKKKGRNAALGLMQVTPQTARILGNEKGELKDHYVSVSRKDLLDPNLNICAGIRWLFQKKSLASNRLGHDSTWEEAIEEYKGILGDLIKGKKVNPKIMSDFNDYFEDLKQCQQD